MSVEPTFTMIRGDDWSQGFVAKYSPSEDPVDLTDAELRFTVRKKKTGDIVFQKKNTAAGGSDAEIEVTDAVNGEFTVYIASSDTEEIEGDLKYWFDAEMIKNSLKTTLGVPGRLEILYDITY